MKILKALVIIAIVSAATFGQNTISTTLRSVITRDSWNPYVIVYTTHALGTSKLTLVNFDYLGQGWSEGLLGLEYSPSDIFFATLFVGVETNSWWRLAGEANLKLGIFSWYNYFEAGVTPYCWQTTPSVTITKSFKILAKAYVSPGCINAGPGVSWSIAPTPMTISPTVLYNTAVKRFSLQLDISANF
jgi:hypothetical protein